MAEWIFDAPGWLKDFSDPGRWNALMAREAEDIVTILVATALNKNPDDVTDQDKAGIRDKLAYVNPTQSPPPDGATTIAIQGWNGFPRGVVRASPWKEYPPVDGDLDGNYRAAEHHGDEDHAPGRFVDRHGQVLELPVRDRQDEYLEWVAKHDSEGKIVKLTFVAEGYDYFYELFKKDEEAVVGLYQHFTGDTSIKADDLRAKNGIYRLRDEDGAREQVAKPGAFNPRNKYNIDPGIVHLSHRANSLGAEINLAGVSGIARKKASGALVDGKSEEELLCCNYGGDPNRNSDPLISAQAYGQVLQGYRYTLANPVGLYIAAVEEAGLLLPDNKTQIPREWWHVVRGQDLWDAKKSRVLRLELEVPASEKITISDLLVGGSPVKFPGQIAELLSVHLFVTAWKRADASVGPTVNCSATCCRIHGGERLDVSRRGQCRPGYDLAFPDLLPAAKPAAGVAEVALHVTRAASHGAVLRSHARR